MKIFENIAFYFKNTIFGRVSCNYFLNFLSKINLYLASLYIWIYIERLFIWTKNLITYFVYIL